MRFNPSKKKWRMVIQAGSPPQTPNCVVFVGSQFLSKKEKEEHTHTATQNSVVYLGKVGR